MFSWIWGPGTRVTSRDRVILDLKRQRDKIKQYQKRITSIQQRERELARQCLAQKDRARALIFLRKEKLQRELLVKTDAQLATLEDLVASIEFSQIQRDVIFGLEQGNQVLQMLNSEMSREKVERILDDTEDGVAYQREVSDMLSERISAAGEADVERELAAMEADIAGAAAANALEPNETPDRKLDLPTVPSELPGPIENSIKTSDKEDEDRLEARILA